MLETDFISTIKPDITRNDNRTIETKTKIFEAKFRGNLWDIVLMTIRYTIPFDTIIYR